MPSLLKKYFVIAIFFLLNFCICEKTIGDESSDVNDDQKNVVALIIGNNKYTSPLNELTNPEKDADGFKAALEKINPREIFFYKNTTYQELAEAVAKFTEKLKPDTVGVVYYSGHGAQLENENYLIPVGVKIANKNDLRLKGFELSKILESMQEAQNLFNIIFLDACRDRPSKGTKGLSSISTGLAPVIARSGIIISYATAPGYTVDDLPEQDNSLYTWALLKNFNSGVDVEKMLKWVGRDVSNKNETQVPWMNSSYYGEYCFGGCKNITPPSQASSDSNSDLYEMILLTTRGAGAREALEKLVKKGKALNSVTLYSADFSNTSANNAILPYASVEWSNLYHANFSSSDFSNASLFCSTLAEANFKYSRFDGADLTGADVTRADFTNTNIKIEQLKNTCIVFDVNNESPLPKVDFQVDESMFSKCNPMDHGIRKCLETK
ncbi:caspase family protein [Methylovulum miyakonense]|uniref:caspase family protein n=1 Tax=Methylovulum miyakonense TaxID=645578 RepID=UPI0003646D54|nr:caspase family protein [Methylovulum miyakonense]